MRNEAVLWYYVQGTERRGPVTDDKLAHLLAYGEVTPETLLWNASLPGWVAARTVFAAPPLPPPPTGPLALPHQPLPSDLPAATVPNRTPTAQVQGQAAVNVKKMSVLLMFVLTVVTFGFYYNIWFLNRREELNNLRSQRKLGIAPIAASLTAAGIFLLLYLFSAKKGTAGVFYLIDYACLLYATVRVANMVDDHCRAMGQTSNARSGFAGCGVIFFGPFWLQHCINKYLTPTQQSEGKGATESSFFPGTMKTPTKIALGSLAVLGAFFVVFIVTGVLVGKAESPFSGSSASVSDKSNGEPSSDLPIPSDDPRDITLLSAMLTLRTGQRSIDDLQRPCSYRGDPAFVVESLVDDFVIYKVDMGAQADLRIAIEKDSSKYYGEGQGMSSFEHIDIVGGQEFKTVMGTTQMIPAGHYADLHQAHCR